MLSPYTMSLLNCKACMKARKEGRPYSLWGDSRRKSHTLAMMQIVYHLDTAFLVGKKITPTLEELFNNV